MYTMYTFGPAMLPRTKLSILRDHMSRCDYRAALKLAASWHELGEEKEAITRGWAAMTNPKFYVDIGMSPQQLVNEGIAAIRRRYKIT